MSIFDRLFTREINVGGEKICDSANRFKDNSDGSVCYKPKMFSKSRCFKKDHIVEDTKTFSKCSKNK